MISPYNVWKNALVFLPDEPNQSFAYLENLDKMMVDFQNIPTSYLKPDSEYILKDVIIVHQNLC